MKSRARSCPRHRFWIVTGACSPSLRLSGRQVEQMANRDVVIPVHADGMLIGGMTYRLDPEIKEPCNEPRPPVDAGGDASRRRKQALELLRCFELPADKVKCVRVTKVLIDVELSDETL